MKNEFPLTRRQFLAAGAGAAGILVLHTTGCDYQTDRSEYTVFSPGRIGSLHLKNRFVRSATFENAALDGTVSDSLIRLWSDLARGGIGLIHSGVCNVIEETAYGGMVQLWDDGCIDGLMRARDAVALADSQCKLIAQLYHPGVYIGSLDDQRALVESLTHDDIHRLVIGFAQAASRVQKAGWDGVQWHGAHGYLLASFFSPVLNRRQDRYGGPVENRIRLLAEIMTATRELVGTDFALTIKVNATDELIGGIDMNSFPELAAAIEQTGVDAIEISGRNPSKILLTPGRQSYFLPFAEAVNISIPIILTGGNRSIEALEDIAQDAAVDFFGLARPLVREPDLPNRWRKGAGSAQTACISCNGCFSAIMGHKNLHCIVTGR